VARVWTARQNVHYNAAIELMKQPPAGVRIRVFRPLRSMPVGSFTVEPKQIAAAMTLGHEEARQQMAAMDMEQTCGSVSD
jgi:predicted patatin/cPLA2 family phospholipase